MVKKTPQVNNMFLIGSGFTKAVFPKAPLNTDLLQSIINNNPETLLRKYQIRYRTDDIEILLTRMDLETVELQSERLRKDRKKINEDIAKYFEQFRFKKERLETNKWLVTLAEQLFKDNDEIITTNYDCFLEGLLDYCKVWHPTKGYINAYDPSELTNSPKTRENPKRIKFYKIHGSEHFRECKVLDEKGETGQTILGFIINESIYPVSGENRQLGWVEELSGEYIVAPSFVKIPHFQIADMVNKANDVAKTAQNMVIIGSSLRNEDIFLRLILTGFISQALQNKKKLITVDPNADSILEKIEKFWIDGTQHITFHQIPKKIEEGLGDLIKLLEDV